jgi:hypothetical protein
MLAICLPFKVKKHQKQPFAFDGIIVLFWDFSVKPNSWL